MREFLWSTFTGLFFFCNPAFSQGILITDYFLYTSMDEIHYSGFLPDTSTVYLAAELVNENNHIIQRQKIRSRYGHFTGSFDPGEKLATGLYWVRIYQPGAGSGGNFLMYKPLFAIHEDDLPGDTEAGTFNGPDAGTGPDDLQPTGNVHDEFIQLSTLDLTGMDSFILTTDADLYHPGETVHLTIRDLSTRIKPGQKMIVKAVGLDLADSSSYGDLPDITFTSHTDHFDDTANNILSLSGRYLNPRTGRPRMNYGVTVSRLGSQGFFRIKSVDRFGNFNFETDDWPEFNTLYISTIEQNISGLSVTDSFYRPVNDMPQYSIPVNSVAAIKTFAKEAGMRKILREQYTESLTTKPEVFITPVYDTTRVYEKADISYDLSDYIAFQDMEEVAREIMPFVQIVKKKNRHRFRIVHHRNPYLTKFPLFFLNGKPTRDAELVLGLDISQVQIIDVLYMPETLKPFGLSGFGGVMAIYTLEPVQVPNCLTLNYQGLRREVGKPDQLPNPEVPDLSPVIYWEPEVEMQDGKIEISFPLNNILSDVRITAAGMDSNGNILQVEKVIHIIKE
ncbi:MAG TPA: hypothetical protein VI583_16480 [Cyclobacteriaceae bacterium]|nr:hypothetical protein [Cyclobacteriaceae bacterium]